jgi:hypothetical protein
MIALDVPDFAVLVGLFDIVILAVAAPMIDQALSRIHWK